MFSILLRVCFTSLALKGSTCQLLTFRWNLPFDYATTVVRYAAIHVSDFNLSLSTSIKISRLYCEPYCLSLRVTLIVGCVFFAEFAWWVRDIRELTYVLRNNMLFYSENTATVPDLDTSVNTLNVFFLSR